MTFYKLLVKSHLEDYVKFYISMFKKKEKKNLTGIAKEYSNGNCKLISQVDLFSQAE